MLATDLHVFPDAINACLVSIAVKYCAFYDYNYCSIFSVQMYVVSSRSNALWRPS